MRERERKKDRNKAFFFFSLSNRRKEEAGKEASQLFSEGVRAEKGVMSSQKGVRERVSH